MTVKARTEAIDAYLLAHYLKITVREACVHCKCSPETINRRERVLGIACQRHRLKRSSPVRTVEDDLVRKIRHGVWAPPFDYLDEPA